MSKNNQILVTGASGFIALHCIHQALEAGYAVRGTLRSLQREAEVRATLDAMGAPPGKLEFVEADLLSDTGWEQAMQAVDYVLHVASPFPTGEPEHEDDLIRPAREGTLRVLQAAAKASVKRVVQTSSVAAVADSLPAKDLYDENDWSDVNSPIGAYSKSKTLAERAAWEFLESIKDSSKMELVVLNPGLVLGPLPDQHARTSAAIVHEILKGDVPGTARVFFNFVDVRDVAAAHLLAMTNPQAAGQRFILVAESRWMHDLALILAKHYKPRGYKINTLEFPSLMVRFLALFDKTIALTVPLLDKKKPASSQRAKSVLGWQPRSLEEMTVAMAESLIKLGLV